MYAGETITIVAAAQDPLNSNANIPGATAVADFFAPGKNPKNTPGDRTPDKPQIPLTWNPNATYQVAGSTITGAYVGYVNTSGWVGGKWTFRVSLSGTVTAWEYGTFNLIA